MTKVLLLSLCALALFVSSTFAYVHQDVQDQARTILSKVDNDLTQLSSQDRDALLKLGFSEGDLTPYDTAHNTNTMANEDTLSSTPASRFKQLAKGRQQVLQSTTTTTSVSASVTSRSTLPTPTSNLGYTATGNRFFVKAFIPGRGCSSDQLNYVNVAPVCDDSGAPKDGTVDHYVAPMPILSEWFRGDERCFSANLAASYRVGILCEIFKSSTGSRYQVGCAGNAGHTHHWKRRGLLSDGCWYLHCDKLEGFNGRYHSESFTAGTKFRLPLRAADPCVFGAPNIVMDFTVEINIAGGRSALKLTGWKSRFPAMEGYYKSRDAHDYTEWFNWGIDDRTPLSLVEPSAEVKWDIRSFPCQGC